MKLEAYRTRPDAPPLTPGEAGRDWMDASDQRFAYRCLPLTVANTTGWTLSLPCDVTVAWNGKRDRNAISIRGYHPTFPVPVYVQSHFGEGVVTFITGYLFRTPPGVAVWAHGPPNVPKDGAYPLSGLIETDWLPFPFTMNWKMTRSGEVTWKAGEPFCFVTLLEPSRLDAVQPQVLDLAENAELKAESDAWTRSRTTFIERLEAREPEALKEQWQRFYTKGETPTGRRAPGHVTKRRLPGPRSGRAP